MSGTYRCKGCALIQAGKMASNLRGGWLYIAGTEVGVVPVTSHVAIRVTFTKVGQHRSWRGPNEKGGVLSPNRRATAEESVRRIQGSRERTLGAVRVQPESNGTSLVDPDHSGPSSK